MYATTSVDISTVLPHGGSFQSRLNLAHSRTGLDGACHDNHQDTVDGVYNLHPGN